MGIAKHSGSNEPQLHQFGVEAVRENGKVAEGLIHFHHPSSPNEAFSLRSTAYSLLIGIVIAYY